LTVRASLAVRLGSQDGLSLVELLVSMTILAVAATIALVLYDGARQSFKVGENVSEQQQAVRIAFDLLSSDVRQAGFNTNPDGSEARPDEQIEGAFDRAIVIRADFDADDPVASRDPEETLGGAGSAFLTVSTGNDEIRAYVLAKPDGSSGDTLTYQADVGQPVRDGTLETVNIDRVDLSHDDPPYTLYRVTLDEDGSPQRTVLIENVRSMRFRYVNRAGEVVAAPGGMDTPAGVQSRASVSRVGIELEALTRDPDLHWIDEADPDPRTRAFRKFLLAGDVTPRNLGWRGIKDLQSDTVPPSAPAAPQLYPGHCGGLYVVWSANPPADETAYYRLRYGTAPDELDGQRAVDGTQYYLSGLLDGVRYYVALQAIDPAGNQSELGAASSAVTENTNVPEAPLDFTVATGADGYLQLSWQEVTTNEGSTVGDPYSPLVRDLVGYRIYRDDSAGFVPGSGNRIADESDVPATPTPAFVDRQTVSCRDYYYLVRAVDRCGTESQSSAEREGRSYTSVQPAVPTTVEAFFDIPPQVAVNWDPVTLDVNGDPVGIDRYEVFRAGPLEGGVIPSVPESFSLHAIVEGETRFAEIPPLAGGDTVWYAVRAVDDCINTSDYSEPASPACAFAGRLEILEPVDGATVWGETTIRFAVVEPAGTYSRARVHGYNEVTYDSFRLSFADPGPVWSGTWEALPDEGFPEGRYEIVVRVEQVVGTSVCEASATIHVLLDLPWD